MSPCPSFGRCWPRFPSASLAGGWPTAATGSDAGILMANQEADEDFCPERPGGAEGPLCIPWKESALRSIATKVLCSYPARQVVLRSVATKEFSSTSHESAVTAIASPYLATSLLRCFLISLKKLFPCGIVASKFSAIVCPISASVSRTPRFTPAPPAGEYAKIGTYSREWSVVAQRGSGSHPWSAVIISMSERLSSGKNSPSMQSNSSSDLANPSTSFRWPYSMSKSTRLQKISPLARSLTAAVSFSIPSVLFLVVTYSSTPRPL